MNLTMYKTKLSFTLSLLCIMAGFGISSVYFNHKLMLVEQNEQDKLMNKLRMINVLSSNNKN